MFSRHLSFITAGALLFSALTASAQEPRPERPSPSVFGGGTDQFEQVLAVNGAVGTGYDTSPGMAEVEAGLQQPSAAVAAGGSIYNQFSGGLSYSVSLARVSFATSLSSSARQYPQVDLPIAASHGVSVGSSVSLTKKTSLSGSVATTYQSRRGFIPFPELNAAPLGQIEAPSADYGTGHSRYFTYMTTAGVTQQLSRRASLTAGYSRQTSQFSSGSENLTQQTGAFRFTRTLTRNLGLRLGYGYSEAEYGSAGRPYQNHNLDTGVDYSRDLSLTRRTKLAFSTGATALRQNETTRYEAIGSATLNREIGRTWSASLSYRRNVGFIESVFEPVFYDGISAGFGGLITRRLSFRSGVGATRGSVGIGGGPARGFDAMTAFSGINQALTRHLALGVNYTYYHYNFQPGAAAATGLGPGMNRHSVNVMLNAWAPLFQHGRKKNASR